MSGPLLPVRPSLTSNPALCLWLFLYLREDELRYSGSSAPYVMMELRLANTSLPPNPEPRWFRVEMESSQPLFPTADVYWDKVSTEANHSIYPALYSPFYRSRHRGSFESFLTNPNDWFEESFPPV